MLYSNEITEYKKEYDCGLSNCTVTFAVTSSIQKPVYLYYAIEGYHQNHRIYVKSRSPKQLAGKVYQPHELTECEPITTVKDLDISSIKLDPSSPANPCGLIAKSFFQDTFSFVNGLNIIENGIAWPSDRSGKYANSNNWKNLQWHSVEDEHFMVWMRVAATSNFRKLWGIINETLEVGEYVVEIHEKMNFSAFGRLFLYFIRVLLEINKCVSLFCVFIIILFNFIIILFNFIQFIIILLKFIIILSIL